MGPENGSSNGSGSGGVAGNGSSATDNGTSIGGVAQGGAPTEEEARARSLAVLEATHQFPCEYAITVIAFNREPVTAALLSEAAVVVSEAAGDAAAGGATADPSAGESDATRTRYQVRASREGKYLSHRFYLWVNHAAEVLELYARFKAVDGVVTIL